MTRKRTDSAVKIAGFLFFVWMIPASFAASAPLQLDDVIDSVYRHYPTIFASERNVESQKQDVISKQGAFDFRIHSNADFRPQGFYDGHFLSVEAQKPLMFGSTMLRGGYRVSDGTYPDYEGKMDTLNQGEFNAGVDISILRNRSIDSNRVNLWNSQLQTSIESLRYKQVKMNVHRDAIKAYWKWVASGHIYQIYNDLLTIALNREKALSQRVEKGDLAEIYLAENRQYIAKRQAQVAHALQGVQNEALNLSLYFRNEDGRPKVPGIEQIPSLPNEFSLIEEDLVEQNIQQTFQEFPELVELDITSEQLNNQEKLGRNDLFPKLDVSWEVSKDVGDGMVELEGTENRGIVQLEIPIERRKGKGAMKKARYKKESIGFKKQIKRDQLETSIRTLWTQMRTQIQTIQLSRNEIEWAIELEKAENIKFKEGASDFFVLNLREQNTVNARIQNIKEIAMFKFIQAEYLATTMQLHDK